MKKCVPKKCDHFRDLADDLATPHLGLRVMLYRNTDGLMMVKWEWKGEGVSPELAKTVGELLNQLAIDVPLCPTCVSGDCQT